MKLPVEIENKVEQLIILCNKYNVIKLFVFGSIAKGKIHPETSDIDLIVELENLPPTEKGEKLMNFWSELEVLFSRKVDLLSSLNIKNPYLRKEIGNSKFLLYDRAS